MIIKCGRAFLGAKRTHVGGAISTSFNIIILNVEEKIGVVRIMLFKLE